MKTLALARARRPLRFLIAGSVVLLAGCQTLSTWAPPIVRPYRPDLQQGNVVTKEMVEQLRQGMSREQVRFLLGTPLLTSVFHQERWDYVYHLKRGRSGEEQTRRLTVFFKDNRLDAFRSDEMPPETMADNLILGRDASKIQRNPPVRPSEPGRQPPGPIN